MIKNIGLTGLSLLILFVGSFLKDAGYFKDINPHFSGHCDVVPGVVGAEDISFLPNSNVALVSAYDRRNSQEHNGGIFSYDLASKQFVKISPPMKDFRPHGISLYSMPDGGQRLFVINHSEGKHAVNIFNLINGQLTLFKTVEGEGLISPNDLVAVGPEQFYVTNDHHYKNGVMRLLEDYLSLKLSSVVHYDGKVFKEVLTDLGYANGINVSRDGKSLYLSALTARTLNVYRRNLNDNELTLKKQVDTGTGIDNIELDENGDLWIGAHPQLLKFVSHAKDNNKYAPSQVLKVSVADGSFKVSEVLLDSGSLLSASSVGAVKGNRMLVGAVFDAKILDCTMDQQLTAGQ